MKFLLPILSLLGLALVIVPAVAYLAGWMEKDPMKQLMLTGTLLWFATVPFWMGKKRA